MERLHAWFESRLPRSDHHEMHQRNIYIVPTGAGWFFGAVLLVLLLASINYQLSLGYALTFLLAGSALVSMHMTHGTLRRLRLHLRAGGPVFAGQPAALDIVLDSPGGDRYGIGLGFRRNAADAAPTWIDVPGGGHSVARLQWTPPARGWHDLPSLKVETRFPLGLFRAWSIWRPAARVLAWPRPEHPDPPLPLGQAHRGEGVAGRDRSPSGEFEGVRPWRHGDSLRQVVWKKVARADASSSGDTLISRESAPPYRRELWLDWPAARTPDGDTESRLSRLAAWVLRAEREGAACGLRLPGIEIEPARGDGHRRLLLEALALWSR